MSTHGKNRHTDCAQIICITECYKVFGSLAREGREKSENEGEWERAQVRRNCEREALSESWESWESERVKNLSQEYEFYEIIAYNLKYIYRNDVW